jgi:hypothetical protein
MVLDSSLPTASNENRQQLFDPPSLSFQEKPLSCNAGFRDPLSWERNRVPLAVRRREEKAAEESALEIERGKAIGNWVNDLSYHPQYDEKKKRPQVLENINEAQHQQGISTMASKPELKGVVEWIQEDHFKKTRWGRHRYKKAVQHHRELYTDLRDDLDGTDCNYEVSITKTGGCGVKSKRVAALDQFDEFEKLQLKHQVGMKCPYDADAEQRLRNMVAMRSGDNAVMIQQHQQDKQAQKEAKGMAQRLAHRLHENDRSSAKKGTGSDSAINNNPLGPNQQDHTSTAKKASAKKASETVHRGRTRQDPERGEVEERARRAREGVVDLGGENLDAVSMAQVS